MALESFISYNIQSKISYCHIQQKTTDVEIGIYFKEDNPDGTREYSTIVFESPKRDIYQGLDNEAKYGGEPFRNSTDVIRKYQFNHVGKLNIVIIGNSEDSLFDIGVSVSSISIDAWKNLQFISNITIGTVLLSTFLYVLIKNLVKALQKRSHSEFIDEEEPIEEAK